MATIRQRAAAKNLVGNGGNVTQAMRDAGYSENTLNTPGKLTQSKGFISILEDLQTDLGAAGVNSKKLARVIKQGLAAKQPGKLIIIDKRPDGDGVTKKTIESPDHKTRHQYLDTALKVLGGYPKEDKSPTNLILAQFKAMANEYTQQVPDRAAEAQEAEVVHAEA